MFSIYRFKFLLFLFFLSGFSGLIYESIWSKYLKLFLGHAAYAQALVLIIFMGGMALGAWFTGRYIHRIKHIFLVYAAVEILIGLIAIFFHPLFTWLLGLSLDTIIPALDNIHLTRLYQWSFAALLILPQSLLLGSTFPLMANGAIRHYKQSSGYSISLLYFSNSFGAALGVLASGYVLLQLLGLPGTVITAGIINIIIALFLYYIGKQFGDSDYKITSQVKINFAPMLLLLAACFTGMASFIYEVTWIRMLSLVLGSSTHAFELMLSAFILGLALGGFYIRKKVDQFSNPIQFIGQIQIMMGLLAIISIPLYHYCFDFMALLISNITPSDKGYLLFIFSSHVIAALIMLPTTFCAGMTLPLLTNVLLQQGYGEKSISHVYSANTMGAIIGVVLTVFILLPQLGLKNSIVFGGFIDISLGLIILTILQKRFLDKYIIAPAFASFLVIAIIIMATGFDTSRLTSGVYRTGQTSINNLKEVLFYRDGKTASIGVSEFENGRIMISTNGKPDATIAMKEHTKASPDEITMILAAALPIALHPKIEQAANIGMGSGLTSHVLLHSPKLRQLDTIEIEPMMVEGAKHFLPRVKNVYEDDRSQIFIEDAKTFFSVQKKQYDLIVSEPSNPWVSGTASLFTEEFYHQIKKHLKDDGVFVQWLQIYEINTELLMTVLKALDKQFPHYRFFSANNSDILILAQKEKPKNWFDPDTFNNENIKGELNSVGIYSIRDIFNRYLGDERLFRPLIKKQSVSINSDYYPVLDLNAEQARFLKKSAKNITEYRTLPFPLVNFFHDDMEIFNYKSTDDRYHTISKRAYRANLTVEAFTNNIYENDEFHADIKDITFLKEEIKKCQSVNNEWTMTLSKIVKNTIPYLGQDEIRLITNELTPACPDLLKQDQKLWLELFSALGNRDLDKINENSYELLKHANGLENDDFNTLFVSYILSSALSGKIEPAKAIWQQHINRAKDSLSKFQLSLIKSFINI